MSELTQQQRDVRERLWAAARTGRGAAFDASEARALWQSIESGEENGMDDMQQLASEIELRASTLVRQSHESIEMRVAQARALAEALAGSPGFELDFFVDDCFAADVHSGMRFDVDGSTLYASWNREQRLAATGLTVAEAQAFSKLNEAATGIEPDDTLTIEGGTGIVVSLFTGEDGAPIVQIDTPPDTDLHEQIRVHLNDSAARWTTTAAGTEPS